MMAAVRVVPQLRWCLTSCGWVLMEMPHPTVEIAPEVWRPALEMAYGGRADVQVYERKEAQGGEDQV